MRLVLPLLAGLALGGPAFAHATLEASEPAHGAVLRESPRRVAVRFDTPARVTVLRLLDARGQEAPLRREGGRGPGLSAAAAVPAPLAPGAWRLEWRVVSEDGHVMTGVIPFTVAPR